MSCKRVTAERLVCLYRLSNIRIVFLRNPFSQLRYADYRESQNNGRNRKQVLEADLNNVCARYRRADKSADTSAGRDDTK